MRYTTWQISIVLPKQKFLYHIRRYNISTNKIWNMIYTICLIRFDKIIRKTKFENICWIFDCRIYYDILFRFIMLSSFVNHSSYWSATDRRSNYSEMNIIFSLSLCVTTSETIQNVHKTCFIQPKLSVWPLVVQHYTAKIFSIFKFITHN